MSPATNTAMSTPIEIRGLEVTYGRSPITAGTPVLDAIDLRVEEGGVHALVGRNGAGKSSLVRCLLGQQKPTGGDCRLFGQDAWRHRARLMARIGVVPEEPDAPPSMTPKALARFCSRLYPSWDGDAYEARLTRFAVPLRTPFAKLSRGQKTQVMLALALAPRPELLVLDDPTLGLDPIARDALFEELVDVLAEHGTTVILTSHDLPGIERIGSHASYLSGGRLVFDEEIEELKARHRRIVLAEGIEAELDALDIASERSRGRDRELWVRRFDQGTLKALVDEHGADRVRAEPMTFEEILLAAAES